MTHLRRAGILLHPTSLPGPHGSGDLGPAAFHFVDWLAAGGQTLWQILPLGGIGPGNSPYMSPSAFAGNELLIDLSRLCEAGWLADTEIAASVPFNDERVDYDAVRPFRRSCLRLAARRFFADVKSGAYADFAAFCEEERGWLEDYALFMALAHQPGRDEKAWQEWPAEFSGRQHKALADAVRSLAGECGFWKFCQWLFDRQWAALRKYANARDVRIVGDIPIFVSGHSADVWARQNLFDLDSAGWPRVVAGVPPDYFSATGQRWGNPLYRWEEHARDGYSWWTERLRHALKFCDVVRIDHFRGFESCWEIPADSPTAVAGRWRKGPGGKLFAGMRKALGWNIDKTAGDFRVIAEDLGIITPEVASLRRTAGFPGMRVLQFAFDGKSENPYLPHNHEARTVVYTGTHDNDTTCGWWASLPEAQRDQVRRYFGIDGASIHWSMIRAASASVADASIVPMQDVLGLDGTARMNRPGIAEGNWEWRFTWNQVAAWHAERLAELARLYGRAPRRETSAAR
ncbi:MAG: 4-alpha-glucanotransferase [Candidatus Accumulibacter sp.]|jgi:4-alpha-glucanotransferase|nr:4-alpha-glucanotransferase [Accumulibacter sp.]